MSADSMRLKLRQPGGNGLLLFIVAFVFLLLAFVEATFNQPVASMWSSALTVAFLLAGTLAD